MRQSHDSLDRWTSLSTDWLATVARPTWHSLCHFTANHFTDTDKQNSTGKL